MTPTVTATPARAPSREGDPPSRAAIDIEGLTVVRGGNTVLRDVVLTVPAGRIVGLLGPSGCGKSTLMRTIVGVQAGATGAVTVLGEPAGAAGLRRRVGYVTQAASVYSDLTVRENLQYFRRLVGAPAARVDAVIEAVRLEQRADQLTSRLSGGQRTRVSLAAALLGEPELLVLDEPTVGLDPVLRLELWALFRSFADAGATLLVSSHVMDEADRCDDLLLMREGVMVAADTPAGLRARTGAPDVESAFLTIVENGDPS